jgi:hypothetical protein
VRWEDKKEMNCLQAVFIKQDEQHTTRTPYHHSKQSTSTQNFLIMAATKKPYVPFSQREEWKDVTPVLQDDGPNPVCKIAYDPKCMLDILFML